MNGAGRVFGSGVGVRIAGRMVYMRPLTLAMLGELEFYILSGRFEDFDRAKMALLRHNNISVQGVDVSTARKAALRKKAVVSADEILAFIDTPIGLLYTLWQSTRPQLDYEEIANWLSSAKAKDIDYVRRCRNMVSCLDQMTSADWWSLQSDESAEEEDDIGEKRGMKWRRIAREMGDEHDWDDISGMTLHRLLAYRVDPKSLGIKRKDAPRRR